MTEENEILRLVRRADDGRKAAAARADPARVPPGQRLTPGWPVLHVGRALPVEHGGPLRLVVPSRYGWMSVKWGTKNRLTDRDVPAYWEERGYHKVADPWREQRFRGDRRA